MKQDNSCVVLELGVMKIFGSDGMERLTIKSLSPSIEDRLMVVESELAALKRQKSSQENAGCITHNVSMVIGVNEAATDKAAIDKNIKAIIENALALQFQPSIRTSV